MIYIYIHISEDLREYILRRLDDNILHIRFVQASLVALLRLGAVANIWQWVLYRGHARNRVFQMRLYSYLGGRWEAILSEYQYIIEDSEYEYTMSANIDDIQFVRYPIITYPFEDDL